MSQPEDPNGAKALEGALSFPSQALDKVRNRFGGGSGSPPPPVRGGDDDEEDGMLRMSFMEHLEELRSRIFKALLGVAIAFAVSLSFSRPLWDFVCRPATSALASLGYEPSLVQI